MKTEKIEYCHTNYASPSFRTFLKNVIYEYFSPIFISWNKFESITKKLDIVSKEVDEQLSSKKALVITQKAVCFNQSALIQYTYLMAEKHKALKDIYRDDQNNSLEIEKRAKDLIYYLNTEFHKVVFRNFELLHSYFSERSKIKPRICLKGNFNTHHSDIVITVFRDSQVSYQSDYDISENTGFDEVANHGKYYLCNNIPKAVAVGAYKNPRIDILKIKKTKDISGRDKHLQENWKTYWKDSQAIEDDRAFYKSTLIIPMTLWNSELSDEFRKKIKIKNIGRTIFGFLCIDHIEEDYFKDADIRTGYVFADLISNYVFQRSVYTDLSKTFGTIIKELGSKVDSTSSQMPDSIRWDDLHSISNDDLELKLKESRDNYLFGLDEELIEYLGKEKHITKP